MTRVRIAAACALDAIAGDPAGWPHPVRAFGAVIAAVERRRDLRASPLRQYVEGGLLTFALTAAAAVTGAVAERIAPPAAVVLAASALAARSLDDAVARVQIALERDDVAAARVALAHIVGRDVGNLDVPAIAAAALETLAESFCDGVIAPLLWLRAGGAAGALAFKAISTLDSMIGHREWPHTWFGRVAAHADDGANFVPARLCAVAIGAAAFSRRALMTAVRDAPSHRSPNAGWPEAALAGALGVRLGGTAYYGGVAVDRPLLGAEFPLPRVAQIAEARALILRAYGLTAALTVLSAA